VLAGDAQEGFAASFLRDLPAVSLSLSLSFGVERGNVSLFDRGAIDFNEPSDEVEAQASVRELLAQQGEREPRVELCGDLVDVVDVVGNVPAIAQLLNQRGFRIRLID